MVSLYYHPLPTHEVSNGIGHIAPCWVCSRHSSFYGEGYLSRHLKSDTLKKKFIICCNLLMTKILGSLNIVRVITIPSPNGISHPQIVLYALELNWVKYHTCISVISQVYFCQRWYLHLKYNTILSVRIRHLK